MRLLAEHCYTLSDDAIEEMVTAKIPTHSRWESYQEFKEKIDRRDELIKSLQVLLVVLSFYFLLIYLYTLNLELKQTDQHHPQTTERSIQKSNPLQSLKPNDPPAQPLKPTNQSPLSTTHPPNRRAWAPSTGSGFASSARAKTSSCTTRYATNHCLNSVSSEYTQDAASFLLGFYLKSLPLTRFLSPTFYPPLTTVTTFTVTTILTNPSFIH